MIELFAGIALIAILGITVIRERRKAASYDFTRLPDQTWQLREYTGNGLSVDYYAEFDAAAGKFVPDLIYKAAALVEQRRSGRWGGRHITVFWRPGLDWDIDNHAKWLQKFGKPWGVEVIQK